MGKQDFNQTLVHARRHGDAFFVYVGNLIGSVTAEDEAASVYELIRGHEQLMLMFDEALGRKFRAILSADRSDSE